jgi:arsenate reductase
LKKPLALFVCIHNSARSQMAEAFARKHLGDRMDVVSAGLERGTLNPVVVDVMRERGLDLSQNKAKSIADIGWQVLDFAYVVTVCDDASAEACPVVPTSGQRLHWSFADPSTFRGTSEEVYAQTRRVRDDIERAIDEWVASVRKEQY